MIFAAPRPVRSFRAGRHGLAVALLATIAWCAVAAQAQTLSSPLPPSAVKGKTPVAVAAKPAPLSASGVPTPPLELPVGQGAGVHGANSPFAPLSGRADVVPWSVLTDVKTKTEKNRILPVFNLGQLELHQKTQRVQGFMMPLDPGEKQTHFLLSSVPLTCSFCIPGGPESMVEVKTKTPVKYSVEPLVVEGRFLVLNDDSFGLYYRMTDAASVR